MQTVIDEIKKQIKENKILLYMKGTPDFPQCGFSLKAVRILSNYTKNFMYIDVLSNISIRAALPKFSNWPTFPQLWINGDLIGGCDIMNELHKNGELKILINKVFQPKQKILEHDGKS